MNNNSFEKYMQGIIGYQNMPNKMQNNLIHNNYKNLEENNSYNTTNNITSNNILNEMYEDETIGTNEGGFNSYQNTSTTNTFLDKFYPEIYKLVNPMIIKICDNISLNTINKQIVDNMTDEIYFAIEEELDIIGNTNNGNSRNNYSRVNPNIQNYSQNNAKTKNDINNRNNITSRRREIRNMGLHDLIQILLIRELYNKPNFRPNIPNRPRPNMYYPRPPYRPR